VKIAVIQLFLTNFLWNALISFSVASVMLSSCEHPRVTMAEHNEVTFCPIFFMLYFKIHVVLIKGCSVLDILFLFIYMTCFLKSGTLFDGPL
jgi:hypothetical protein